MAKLVFEGLAIIDGKIVSEYLAKPDERLLLFLFSPPSAYCCDTLELCGGKPCENSGFCITDYGETFLICAMPPPPTHPPIALCKKSGALSGNEYILTAYKDNSIKLFLETEGKNRFIVPKVDISNPDISISSQKNNLLFAVSASCAKGDYLLILSASDMQTLFEDSAQSISLSGSGFTVVKAYEDMCMRQKSSIYAIGEGKIILKSNMFTYSNEHIYIDALKPYLLLEALFADDYEYARMLLTDELAENAESLKEYFGEIAEIENPRYNKDYADIAIVGKDRIVRYYKFEFSYGDISNIILL